jgi:nitrogen fixation/metabolism regulation signal transduction histidine kinase
MVFNRYFLFVLLRVLLLFGTLLILVQIFLRPDLLFTQIILATVIIIQVIELVQFVNRTNVELNRFLASIKDGDFSINFSRQQHMQSFRSLNASFRNLVETFRELETESNAQNHFLNQLIDQIDFGIISFDQEDKISLINEHALKMLSIPKIRRWQNIQNPNIQILESFLAMNDGMNQLMEVKMDGRNRFLTINANTIIIREVRYKLISFQDIRSEIQQKEIEAWHQLIRILTHEIMNSVTPLVSLTETMQMIITTASGEVKKSDELETENIEDIYDALDTVKDRIEGILRFVQDYRKLTRIPKPEKEIITDSKLINSVVTLMQADSESKGIHVHTELMGIQLNVDPNLIQQVLINLMKNAMEALDGTDNPQITFMTSADDQVLKIAVIDNGTGIPENKINKVFVPFYSTKTDGSGVGLPVSRQIMNLHSGHIELDSKVGRGTTFTLIFPKT